MFHTTHSTTATYYPKKPESGTALDGLDYRQARYYDSDLGLFLSVDPLGDYFTNYSTYHYAFNNPIRYVDPDGREPIKPLVGSIQQAIDFFRSQGFSTVQQINAFYKNPTNANNEPIKNYPRYIFTTENGWIDLRHYFGAIINSEIVMDFVENVQCAAGSGSCYSYEDLPSNAMGGRAPVWKDITNPDKKFSGKAQQLLENEALFFAVLIDFKFAGASKPSEAPTYDKLPYSERPKVPDINYWFYGFPIFYTSEQKKEMIKTGNYVPQNFSEEPYDLNDFPTPGTKFMREK